MLQTPTEKRETKTSHELAWFRITVVVASAGYCTGQLLIWLNR